MTEIGKTTSVPASPQAQLVAKKVTDEGDPKPDTEAPVLYGEGEEPPVCGIRPVTIGEIKVQGSVSNLDIYRKGLAQLCHDIRTPLNAIYLKIVGAKNISEQINSSETVRNVESIFKKLLIGKITEQKAEPSILDNWRELAQAECTDSAAVLDTCRRYGKSVAEHEVITLCECLGQVVQEMKGVPALREYADHIEATAPGIVRLVTHFNECEGHDFTGQPERFNPAELVAQTVGIARDSWHGLQMNITVSQSGEIGQICMDKAFLMSGLMNLISNSAKACQRQGLAGDDAACEIRLSQTGDNVVIEITDNGPGIPQEIIGSIEILRS